MRRLESSLPSGRALAALDVALAAWVIAWVAMGIFVAAELRGLAELSDTVGTVGRAAESSGEAIELLGGLPLIGEALGAAFEAPAREIQEAGQSAQESGAESRQSIETLTVLLGLSIAVIPSLPILAGYLPVRIARLREARAIESVADRDADDPALQEFLARRAAQSLSYRQLSKVTREPWRDLAEGRFDRLARAELDRLGLVHARRASSR